jgi:hypothetical protein
LEEGGGRTRGTNLTNNITHFLLHLLLRPHKALPQIIAYTTALQQQRQSLFLVSDGDDTFYIFCGAT